jgi:hypothetical protein
MAYDRVRFALSKGPNRVGVFALNLRTETDQVSETSFSSFLIPDDGQSPNTHTHTHIYIYIYISKAISVTGRGGRYGFKMLRIPHCLDSRLTDGGRFVSPTHRPLLYTPEAFVYASGTHFCIYIYIYIYIYK